MDPTLQKRLIGASVLIVLAIIFVPMLLNGTEHTGSETLPLAIPEMPEGDFETRELPLDAGATPAAGSVAEAIGVTPPARPDDPDALATVDTAASARTDALSGADLQTQPPASDALTAAAATAPPESAQSPAEIPAAIAAQPAPVQASPPVAATSSPVSAATPPTAQGRFLVGLGSYSNQANTAALIAQLKGAGFKVLSDVVTVNGQNATRLRVGPYATRGQAEAARLAVKAVRADLPAAISEMDDSSSADVPAVVRAPGSGAAWAVQIGAFKVESEAMSKRDQLRQGGFAAFIEKINADSGALFRVRVGPENKRSDADSVKAGIKNRFGLDGIVVPYP